MSDNNPSPVPDILVGQVRIALVAFGSWLFKSGFTDSDMSQTLAGGASVLAVIAWSVYSKLKANAKLKDAIAAPVGKAAP